MAHISFLDLPYEIRLQIYHLVYLSSPVPHTRFPPFIFASTYASRAILPDSDISEAEVAVSGRNTPERRLLSSHRPVCCMPTSFLQSCRQIYHEARFIPFQENEFAFIDWFTSGLRTALSFSIGLTSWQVAELRYVRLEACVEGIIRGDLHSSGWMMVCGLWKGLRGLKLVLNTKGHRIYYINGVEHEPKTQLRELWELVEEGTSWIDQGLSRMSELQQLEVELSDDEMPNGEKLRWCSSLQKALRGYMRKEDVFVICVSGTTD